MVKAGRKPLEDKKRRKHTVTCRLTDEEAVNVDDRRGKMTRGEWIRTQALLNETKSQTGSQLTDKIEGMAQSLDEKIRELKELQTGNVAQLTDKIEGSAQSLDERIRELKELQTGNVAQLTDKIEGSAQATDKVVRLWTWRIWGAVAVCIITLYVMTLLLNR